MLCPNPLFRSYPSNLLCTMQLQNYACGQWIAGTGKQAKLVDVSTGEFVAISSSSGLDFKH